MRYIFIRILIKNNSIWVFRVENRGENGGLRKKCMEVWGRMVSEVFRDDGSNRARNLRNLIF